MGKETVIYEDFSHLARLALSGSKDDVELYIRRFSRRRKQEFPELCKVLDDLTAHPTRGSIVREQMPPMPVDTDSRLQLLRIEHPTPIEQPVWSELAKLALTQVVNERLRIDELETAGIPPARSALFIGPPGVGKTLSARWLASTLNLPLLTLDLSSVMSSFLGRTGGNLRSVTDYARQFPCVLLLDEFDAIAKRRDDTGEVGELKRLVTVLLQELETWPSNGFLIAASNHPELLDPAVWRRFDIEVRFATPTNAELLRFVSIALNEIDSDDELFAAIACAMEGMSFSDAQRAINSARRRSLMENEPLRYSLLNAMRDNISKLQKKEQISIAMRLGHLGLSQYDIERITGVSRPTQRKYLTAGGQ